MMHRQCLQNSVNMTSSHCVRMQDYDAALALVPSNITALLRKGQVLQSLGKNAVSSSRSYVLWAYTTGNVSFRA